MKNIRERHLWACGTKEQMESAKFKKFIHHGGGEYDWKIEKLDPSNPEHAFCFEFGKGEQYGLYRKYLSPQKRRRVI